MFGDKLGKIAKAVEKKHPQALIDLLKDKGEDIVLAAIEGLGKINLDESFNALIPILSDKNAKLRGAAAAALGAMGNDHAKAFIAHALSIEPDADAKKLMGDAMARLRTE